MAMLAEPKRRTKYSLNPRGNSWSNDENKFGQKLMEKMGWSNGKGLGRNEQGSTDHIRVQLKSDYKGVGFDGNNDKSIAHYDAFEDVLANLQNINSGGDDDQLQKSTAVDSDPTETIFSLEAKSKKSKARLHYHKFTRGKDTSRFTEDDMACILGSKRSKRNQRLENEAENAETVDKETGQEEQEEVGHVQTNNGVTTIKGGSVTDYFKEKMAAFMKRKQMNTAVSLQSNYVDEFYNANDDHSEEVSEEVPCPELKKKKKKKSKDKHQTEDTDELNTEIQSIVQEDINVSKAKSCLSRSKKSKGEKLRVSFSDELENDTVIESSEMDDNVFVDSEPPKKKSKKSRKRDIDEVEISIGDCPSECEITSVTSTKKENKKNKLKSSADISSIIPIEVDPEILPQVEINDGEKKKKKSKKNKHTFNTSTPTELNNESISDENVILKSKKKLKHEDEQFKNIDNLEEESNDLIIVKEKIIHNIDENDIEIVGVIKTDQTNHDTDIPKNKTKKKKKKSENLSDSQVSPIEIETENKSKKSKRKRKRNSDQDDDITELPNPNPVKCARVEAESDTSEILTTDQSNDVEVAMLIRKAKQKIKKKNRKNVRSDVTKVEIELSMGCFEGATVI